MINEKNIRQVSEGCGFVHRLLSKSSTVKKEVTPRETSINKVKHCIKTHKKLTRKRIMDKAGISGPCLDRVLDLLLDKKEIEQEFVRYLGIHKQYIYSMPTTKQS